jgi:hypothetical protein
MAGRRRRLVAEPLDEIGQLTDHSLAKKAWDRAQSGKLPRTMTPWEWEQWYAENGIPNAHRDLEARPPAPSRGLRFRKFLWEAGSRC